MLKYCRDKWYENKDILEEEIRGDRKLNGCDYEYLVKLVVDCILNPSEDGYERFDSNNITVIDNGDYQGTQLFMIPLKTYQPSANEYLITYVWYGSCSGCDTLQGIQSWGEKLPTEQQVKDYMTLCKDLVCNMVKPFDFDYAFDEKFRENAE